MAAAAAAEARRAHGWGRALSALALLTVLVALLLPWGSPARAEDRLTVRGNYYRDTSTRVLAPMITFRKELPDERIALETDYLLDVISSASIASGALELGGDKVFTEMRHETTARVTSKVHDWSSAAFVRYSTETDYIATTFGASLARDLLQQTINLSASYSSTFAHVYRITNNVGARSPWTGAGDTNLLQLHYLNLGYSHVMHPQVLGGLNLEGIYSEGPQENPYRRARNGSPEIHPWKRWRFAPSLWLRAMVPQAKMTLEYRYRYYTDTWGIVSHAPEFRVHFRPHRDLLLRLRYRYYTQTEAYFWRDDGVWPVDYPYRSNDPKMDDFRSHTAGLQLRWHLDGISKFKGLGWLHGAWIEATFNYVFVRCKDLSATCMESDFGYGPVRSYQYGDNRYGDLAFSIPF